MATLRAAAVAGSDQSNFLILVRAGNVSIPPSYRVFGRIEISDLTDAVVAEEYLVNAVKSGGIYVSVSDSRSIFLVHASEDKSEVRGLHADLLAAGHRPWIDEKDILPGQDWNFEIRKAIDSVDCVIICLSSTAVIKRGYVRREIKKVVDISEEYLEEDIYILPVRLDVCDVPQQLKKWQYVDLFNPLGKQRLLLALQSVQPKTR